MFQRSEPAVRVSIAARSDAGFSNPASGRFTLLPIADSGIAGGMAVPAREEGVRNLSCPRRTASGRPLPVSAVFCLSGKGSGPLSHIRTCTSPGQALDKRVRNAVYDTCVDQVIGQASGIQRARDKEKGPREMSAGSFSLCFRLALDADDAFEWTDRLCRRTRDRSEVKHAPQDPRHR